MKTVLKSLLGEQYEELGQKILDEVGKRFVPKADFNEANETKKKLEEQAGEWEQKLKDTAAQAEGEDWKGQLEKLQKELESEREGRKQDSLNNLLERSLAKAGAVNMTAAKAVVMEQLKELKPTEDGKDIAGLSDVLEGLRKDESSKVLFQVKEEKPSMQGFSPGEGKDGKPDGQRSAYLEELATARKDRNTAQAIDIKRRAAKDGIVLP